MHTFNIHWRGWAVRILLYENYIKIYTQVKVYLKLYVLQRTEQEKYERKRRKKQRQKSKKKQTKRESNTCVNALHWCWCLRVYVGMSQGKVENIKEKEE